jgi:hypothetical protein
MLTGKAYANLFACEELEVSRARLRAVGYSPPIGSALRDAWLFCGSDPMNPGGTNLYLGAGFVQAVYRSAAHLAAQLIEPALLRRPVGSPTKEDRGKTRPTAGV